MIGGGQQGTGDRDALRESRWNIRGMYESLTIVGNGTLYQPKNPHIVYLSLDNL